jgi:hypothetical protein
VEQRSHHYPPATEVSEEKDVRTYVRTFWGSVCDRDCSWILVHDCVRQPYEVSKEKEKNMSQTIIFSKDRLLYAPIVLAYICMLFKFPYNY